MESEEYDEDDEISNGAGGGRAVQKKQMNQAMAKKVVAAFRSAAIQGLKRKAEEAERKSKDQDRLIRRLRRKILNDEAAKRGEENPPAGESQAALECELSE